MAASKEKTHFVLVHGAWCWYKLKPRLESAGHRVTALDLAASGINMRAIQDIHTLYEYTEPLLELLASLPPNEKVVLVGHSFGGMNLALATDKYPEKKYERTPPEELTLDTEFSLYGSVDAPSTAFLFGPKGLSSKLYQLSPIEDLELAKTLVRPSSLFKEDLSKAKNFSNEGYGSVPRVFIVCDEDMILKKEFQRWMIDINGGANDVMEIKGADHMAMFSKPQELCDCLLEIACKYA